MNTFTGTQLKNKTGDVLSSVQKHGIITIKVMGRPEMVLLTKEQYEENLKAKYSEGEEMGFAVASE